ncbi:4Fe-4S dicluster domain-containing protein [Roseivirga sp. E12]|uniref:4Fe-4S binding protein n=1 Tax=Roseivirga sp. E12 TaxID=2819237 RepID=UPI001ABCC6F3|nr:4Fe-4S dicluster domain-containing protein [Roseivirga sp. E12]MBO3699013.1 4Fe-4S binding protein [Roseivirga sp. E12]
MSSVDPSLSIANPEPKDTDVIQKAGLALAGLGVLVLFLSWGNVAIPASIGLPVALLGILVGTVIYSARLYLNQPEGIKNNGVWFKSLTSRGVLGWVAGIILTGFYVILYWYPEYIGFKAGGNEGMVALFDPLSMFFKGTPASQWFVYGTLYTLCITALGIKFLFKYRHNRYQFIRTLVVIASQLFLAYLIPEILAGLNYNDVTTSSGEYLGYFNTDLKNTWPLDYDFFYDWQLNAFQQEAYQPVGTLYLIVGIAMFLVVTPIITYYVGKRWYCSWVCGCGGLAETAGDPFRHLSSKKLSAWKLERWLIHGVMVFVFVMTAATIYGYFWNTGEVFGLNIYNNFQKPYGFLIGATFSGVIGVGFYPMLGNRVWCRFGCPMAGYMGIIQRFKSRFRITTNGGQCISCGNCSTYCEQGIDVRAYAQKGQNIVRASCVGCGICSAVCPRGVLKLENGPEEGRTDLPPIIIGNESIKVSN